MTWIIKFVEGGIVFFLTLTGLFAIGIESLRYYRIKYNLSDDDLFVFVSNLRWPFRIYSTESLLKYINTCDSSLTEIRLAQIIWSLLSSLGAFALIISAFRQSNIQGRLIDGLWALCILLCVLLTWRFGLKLKEMSNSKNTVTK